MLVTRRGQRRRAGEPVNLVRAGLESGENGPAVDRRTDRLDACAFGTLDRGSGTTLGDDSLIEEAGP